MKKFKAKMIPTHPTHTYNTKNQIIKVLEMCWMCMDVYGTVFDSLHIQHILKR